jgi:beta-lactamase regulating signal transducer with metallopeptidase domain/peroxiredoxin
MNTPLPAFFGWLLRSSWQAGILTVLVLVVQFCLRKRLDGRWRHLLWLLVLARLAMPFSPPSPASLFNYLRFEPAATHLQTVPTADFAVVAPELPIQIQPSAAPQTVRVTAAPMPTLALAPRTKWTTPKWPVLLALMWAVGLTALATRVVFQNILFRRRLRHETVLEDPRTLELFENCKASMRVWTTVRLLETGLVDSPALYGLFRPRLLLPPKLAERFSQNELRHIFLHELAHVRRRDMAAQWLVTCFQIAHWFNPILWFGFRRMAADRELACDELALSVIGETESPAYGQTIIKLLEACSETPALPGLVGILEDKNQIFQRVSMIARFKRHPRWSFAGAVMLVALGLATLTGAQSERAANASRPNLTTAGQNTSPDRQMKGRVVDKTGKPIADAVVKIRGVTRGGTTQFRANNDVDQRALTGADGTFVIDGQYKFDAVGVDVEAPGFARGVFRKLATGENVHELQLFEGATVKGRLVKDASPLSGVRIGLSGVDREPDTGVGSYSVVTDHDGRFCFNHTTPSRNYYLYANMDSLGAQGATVATRLQVEGDGSTLEAGDLQVEKGFTLAGKTRLSDGKLVPPKTRVLLSRDGPLDSSECELDSDGKFQFVGVPSEPIDVTASADGYCLSGRNQSLDLVTLQLTGLITNDKTDLVLELQPGMRNQAESTGYDEHRQEPLAGAEEVYSSQKGIHVTGAVIDAETGKRLNSFTVTDGRIDAPAMGIKWLTELQVAVTNGELDLFLAESQRANAIAVDADGYLPQSSGLITSRGTNITFALKKGPGWTGVVLKPDGQPAVGAQVYLVNMQDGVQIDRSPGTQFTRTDAQGRFQFKARLNDYAVLIFAKAGFAQVTVQDLAEHPEIALRPWAKVEGNLLIGNRPGSNETVRVNNASIPYGYHPRSFPVLGLFLEAITDKDGRFSFDRVPPIDVEVYHSPKVRDEKWGTFPVSQSQMFSLKPGEDRTVVIGGKGRPVIGRLVVNGYDGVINWRSEVWTLDSILPPTSDVPDLKELSQAWAAKIDATDNEDEKKRLIKEMGDSWQEAMAKYGAFAQSENGKKYYCQSRRYALNFAPDGSFRTEDVRGGRYRLQIDFRMMVWRFGSPAVAPLEKEFVIPDSPGGRSDEPFDVGKIEIQARTHLGPGKAAPDFEVKTIDDKTLKLSDFAGKYVLLDFWAVWCGPCIAETPNLKAAYEEFKDDPRFQVIGLSLDRKIKAPRDYAAKNQLAWPIGFLGDWKDTELPNQYGVDGIPSIFLIGPDGKIIAHDLRGPAIKYAVEEAWKKAGPVKSVTSH